MPKIIKISLIVLGIPVLAFVGLIIYEMTIGLPKSPTEAPLSKSPAEVLLPKPPSNEAKKPTACVFTGDPVETWPDETVSDPPIGNVELVKNVHIETFDVFGSNAREVRASIREMGPTTTERGKVDAATRTAINPARLYTKNTADGCTLASVEVAVDITLILPKWVDKASASVQDQKMWDLFFQFAKRHEQGHVNISLKSARELQAELAQQKPAPSCQDLKDKIKALSATARQKRIEAHYNYHIRTNYGSNQMPHEPNQTQYVFPFTCNWSEIKI